MGASKLCVVLVNVYLAVSQMTCLGALSYSMHTWPIDLYFTNTNADGSRIVSACETEMLRVLVSESKGHTH